MVNISPNWECIKEPRGFIRVLQFAFAVLAFATTSGFDQEAKVQVTCTKTDKIHVNDFNAVYELGYPFQVDTKIVFKFNRGTCTESPNPIAVSVNIDKSSTAEFYVTTGVLSFLFSIAALVFYVISSEQYDNVPIFAFIDLISTGILSFFWFVAFCTWASQSGHLKSYIHEIPENVCRELKPTNTSLTITCENRSVKFTSITVSLIFGFANVVLWIGSSWFVYKETTFHKRNQNSYEQRRNEYEPQEFS